MRVNGHPAEAGCYIEGSHGQFALDRVADVAEQFEIEVPFTADPRLWRAIAESRDNPSDWDWHVDAADACETLLNDATEGGYWDWDGGELFLVQSEVEGWLYVNAESYDEAWVRLVDGGPAGWFTDEQDALDARDNEEEGIKTFHFRMTAQYEPEE